jgi:hypothetical protein
MLLVRVLFIDTSLHKPMVMFTEFSFRLGTSNCTPDFDILQWWAVNSARYPILGNIARDVLVVPASSVASESAFSTCGRVITDHRTILGPKIVEALMCYGDWIKHDGNYVFQFSVYPIL